MSVLRFNELMSVDEISKDGKIAKFSIKPLARGYAITIGNSLRRVLTSSMPGAAIVNIEINDVEHEFSTIDGVVEDVMGIILNIKQVIFKVDNNDFNYSQIIEIDVEGKDVVLASDFNLTPEMEIMNPDAVIAHIMPNKRFILRAEVRLGVGYVSNDMNKQFLTHRGQIAVDSLFSPIERVMYNVVDLRGDDEELNIEVETNNAIEAKDAIATACSILIQHFQKIQEISLDAGQEEIFHAEEEVVEIEEEDTNISDLNLSVRLFNSLKRAGIYTVNQLLNQKEEEIRKFRGLGKKSCDELKQKLDELGYQFQSSSLFADLDENDEDDIDNI